MWDILVGELSLSKVSIYAKFSENRVALNEINQGCFKHEI